MLWVHNLELALGLTVVEEELKGPFTSLSLRQARLKRELLAPRPKMVASAGTSEDVQSLRGGCFWRRWDSDAAPRRTQKLPGDGDFRGNQDSWHGVPSPSEPVDFESLWRRDHGLPW